MKSSISHTNREGTTYHLCKKTKKNGSDNVFFKINTAGEEVVESLPPGYEVYENPPGQVFCRKVKPEKITDAELKLADSEAKFCAGTPNIIADRVDNTIIIWTAAFDPSARCSKFFDRDDIEFLMRSTAFVQQNLQYRRMLKFTLRDLQKRDFTVQRWCSRGSIDCWIRLGDFGQLRKLIRRYAPHLG